ncbi:MAG: TFIIB-type zinc ribbon-containing protein [Desulfotomaculales bacterium]
MKICPVCGSSLREIPKYGVLIDACPECRGIWLDRGELEKIVSLAREFHADYVDLHDRHGGEELRKHRYVEDHYYRHKKKKHKLVHLFEVLCDGRNVSTEQTPPGSRTELVTGNLSPEYTKQIRTLKGGIRDGCLLQGGGRFKVGPS